MMKRLRYKYYNKRITTCNNDNVQSHDKERCKLNSGAHKLTDKKIIKITLNKNNVATIKSK